MERGAVYSRLDTIKLWCWYYDENGKRVRCSTGQETEREAKAFLASKLANVARIVANPNRISYKEASVEFLNHIGVPNTKKMYRTAARTLDAYMSKLYLDEEEDVLTALRKYVRDRRLEGVTDYTIMCYLAYIASLYKHFGIDLNPVKRLQKVQQLNARSPGVMRILTVKNEEQLLSRMTDPVLRSMVVFAVETGLRLREQLLLMPDQVDLDRNEIVLRQHQTKTQRGRVVPLSRRALEAYTGIREARPSDAWCFPQRNGKPYVDCPTEWEKVRATLSLRPRWHDLRHTFATRFLTATGDIYALSRLLGHSQITMTTRYLHLVTGDLHARMEQFSLASYRS
jgi:integrase